MADGNTVIHLKREENQPQKLIYVEEEEGEKKKRSRDKNSDLKNTYQFKSTLIQFAMLSICCGISFLPVQYSKLSSTVLQ